MTDARQGQKDKAPRKKPSAPARDEDHRSAFFATAKNPDRLALIYSRAARLLDIPHSMAGVVRIVANLPPIITLARALDPDLSLHFDAIDSWISAFSEVPRDHEFLSISILSKVNRGIKNGRRYTSPPFDKIYGAHSVWTVLWHEQGTSPDQPTYLTRQQAFRELQALYLCAFIRTQLGFCDVDSPKRIYESGLLLRKLRRLDYGTELDRWTAPTDTFDQWQYFSSCHDASLPELRQGYGAFAEVLNQAYSLQQESVFREYTPTNRVPGERKRRGSTSVDLVYDDYSVFQLPLGSGKRMPGEAVPAEVEFEGPGKKDIDEIYQGGASPDEFSTVTGMLVPLDDLLDTKDGEGGTLPPLASLYAAARGRYRAEVMRAQSFVTRRGRPHLPVIGRIAGVLQEIARQSTPPDGSADKKEIADAQETARLCAVCLLTGSTPAEAIRLFSFTDVDSLPAVWTLAYSPEFRVWLRPYEPPERNPLSDAVLANRAAVRPRIALSDVWGVGQSLGPPLDGKWFGHRLAHYSAVYAKSIRPKIIKCGVAADWSEFGMLGSILPAYFEGLEEGESLRNDAIFGRESSQSSVQQHYVALERGRLDAYYTKIMRVLWTRMKNNGLVSPGSLFRLSKSSRIDTRLTGNDWAPQASVIKDTVVALRERILCKSGLSVYDYHNLVVAYVSIGLAVSMVFRDVRTPITDLTLIDPETGFIPVHEKDRSDGAHARLVWIPLVVRDAIEAYLSYLRGLWTRPLGIETSLVVKPTKARDRRMFGSAHFKLSLQRTLFFFEQQEDGTWKAVEFTGTRLMDFVNTIHPGWPIANAGRHFAATRTFNSDAGFATIAKALLGHWHLGESAWSQNSGFDPYRYRDAIVPVIEGMLKDIDFQLVSF